MTNEAPMTADEVRSAIHDLLNSQTMQHICDMAISSPWAADNPAEMKEALTTTALAVIEAIDGKGVQFADQSTQVLMCGLLALVLETVMDGQFAAGLAPAQLQG